MIIPAEDWHLEDLAKKIVTRSRELPRVEATAYVTGVLQAFLALKGRANIKRQIAKLVK